MEKRKNIIYNGLFPLVILLFPLWKAAQGVDYMDSMYSLVNFRFFPEMEGMWVVATFLANVTGYLLTLLPGAGTYLGIRIYTSLLVSITALIAYFWLKKKIPPWLVFIGQMIAIGFCWCPTTILYNYLTYLFMLIALIFLYEGLVKEKRSLFLVAGIFLGMNLMVRFPNVIETGFILAVWFYGFIKKKKPVEVVKDTLWCVGGYFLSVGVFMGVVIIMYGMSSYSDMIASLFSMTDSATSYKPYDMILSIVQEFVKGFKWPLGMALYTVAATGLFSLYKDKFIWIKRSVTLLGILVLFRWYYGQGMFNINYNTYPSMFQWAMTLLIITILLAIGLILHSKVAIEDKLGLALVLLIIAITPIGSNNNLFPVMNNLFIIAPVFLYLNYKIILRLQTERNRKFGFPAQAMLGAVSIAILVQALGFGTTFTFRGGREGEKRDTKIQNNDILKGMYTNAEKAQAIEELTLYWNQRESKGEDSFILFGHIPGVSYFLDTKPAISTSWPDLESHSYQVLEKEFNELRGSILDKGQKPTIIVSYGVSAVINDDANAMEWYGNNIESGEESLDRMVESEKLKLLKRFIDENKYEITFSNQRFVVYE